MPSASTRRVQTSPISCRPWHQMVWGRPASTLATSTGATGEEGTFRRVQAAPEDVGRGGHGLDDGGNGIRAISASWPGSAPASASLAGSVSCSPLVPRSRWLRPSLPVLPELWERLEPWPVTG